MAWDVVANIKGPGEDGTGTGGVPEVWSGINPPSPIAGYLMWIDTDAPAIVAPNSFGTIAVAGQSNVVADAAPDTLTLAAGSNITLTTDATTDTVTIAAAAGGSGATEVWSGPSAPTPLAQYLMWIDTDAVAPISGGDLSFVYTQVGVSSSWSITHNLGKFPSVSVVDTGDSVIIPDVHYIDANSVLLAFAGAISGKAYLN